MTDPEPNEPRFHQAQHGFDAALGDEWEALVRGMPAQAPRAAAFVRGVVEDLAAIDEGAPLSRGQREHMWREVVAMTSVSPLSVPGSSKHASNGVMGGGSLVLPPPVRSSTRARRPGSGGQLLAAALVLLTLLGGIVASGGWFRLAPPVSRGVVMPALVSTPELEQLAGSISEEILLQATLEQMPSSSDGTPQLALWRNQLDPGAEEPVGSPADTGIGNELCTPESGQITVEADAPVFISRAGSDPRDAPGRTEPGTSIVLEAGDQLLAPSGASFLRRNDASSPASLLCFSIGTYDDSARIWASPPGVTYVRGLPFKLLSTFPAAPVDAIVHRLTLAPGGELAIRDLPGLELVYVESGALDLVYEKVDVRDQIAVKPGTPEIPERSFTIRAGSGTDTFGRTPERAVLANRGTEPLVLITASVVPTNAREVTPQALS